jgi:ABC-2 type transport system ATP-binding protein
MLQVQKVRISYNTHEVLRDLSFRGKKGEILGILGKNGVGKTTLLNAIVGLKKIDAGSIITDNKKIGYVPEQQGIYDYLKGQELIEIVADLKNITKQDVNVLMQELSAYIIFPNLKQLVSNYSKGSREKIIFVLALLGWPDILIMDEPFTGFDPESILGAKKYLQKYNSQGRLIIFSTHILELAAQLCHRVLIILSRDKSVIIELNKNDTLEQRIKTLEQHFIE